MCSVQFRAMNTDVLIAVHGRWPFAGRALRDAAAIVAAYERTLSRFDPQSELSHLNRTPGRAVRVSPLLFAAVRAALAAAAATGGLFDPTVLDALEAAGYDRSFDEIGAPGGAATTTVTSRVPVRVAGWERVQVDPAARTVTLPAGVRLDLGGIGKGMAVDAAADRLRRFPGALVDAGGDVRVDGHSPEGGPWRVGVQDPRDPDRDLAVLEVVAGGVATSSVMRRRWRQDGEERHHLIDPRTGASARTDVLAATVVAPTATEAETFAKAAVIAGAEDGTRLLERRGLAGLLVLRDGDLHTTAAMRPLLAS